MDHRACPIFGDRNKPRSSRALRWSGSTRGGTTAKEKSHPTGVNVSMPLAAAQGSPLDFATSWTFLAVISTARAGKDENVRGSSELALKTDRSRQCDLAHLLGRCRDRVLRSRDRVRLEDCV